MAIENALGHHLQLVLTEQPEVGAADSGRPQHASKTGRASVAPLAFIADGHAEPATDSGGDATPAPAVGTG